jgi:hypothetical protein
MKTKIETTTDYEGEFYYIEGEFDEGDLSLELTKALYKGETDVTNTLDADVIEEFEYVLWDKIHSAREDF